MPLRKTPNLECTIPITPIGKTPPHLYVGKAFAIIEQIFRDYCDAAGIPFHSLKRIPKRGDIGPHVRFRIRAERHVSNRVQRRGTGWHILWPQSDYDA